MRRHRHLNLRTLRRSTALACGLVLAMPFVALASSAWSQFQGGSSHAGVVTSAPAPPYRIAWALPIAPGGPDRAFGLSAPVLDGGTVIAVGPEAVIAADAATGRQLWSADREIGPSVPGAVDEADRLLLFTEGWGPTGPPRARGVAATASPSITASPSTAPGAEPGTGSVFPGPSRLVALSLDGDHARAWTVDLPEVSRSGVTLDGATAYVGANDGSLTAVDVVTGEVLWTGSVGGAIDSPVAAGDGVVVASVRASATAGTAANLVALRQSDGARAWSYAPRTRAALVGPPTLTDGTVYAAFADGSVHAVAADSGAVRWQARLNFGSLSAVAVDGEGIFVADATGKLYRLGAGTGDRVWEHALNAPVFRASPVVLDAHVLLTTGGGDAVAFELGSGDLVWRAHLTDGPLRSSRCTASSSSWWPAAPTRASSRSPPIPAGPSFANRVPRS